MIGSGSRILIMDYYNPYMTGAGDPNWSPFSITGLEKGGVHMVHMSVFQDHLSRAFRLQIQGCQLVPKVDKKNFGLGS